MPRNLELDHAAGECEDVAKVYQQSQCRLLLVQGQRVITARALLQTAVGATPAPPAHAATHHAALPTTVRGTDAVVQRDGRVCPLPHGKRADVGAVAGATAVVGTLHAAAGRAAKSLCARARSRLVVAHPPPRAHQPGAVVDETIESLASYQLRARRAGHPFASVAFITGEAHALGGRRAGAAVVAVISTLRVRRGQPPRPPDQQRQSHSNAVQGPPARAAGRALEMQPPRRRWPGERRARRRQRATEQLTHSPPPFPYATSSTGQWALPPPARQPSIHSNASCGVGARVLTTCHGTSSHPPCCANGWSSGGVGPRRLNRTSDVELSRSSPASPSC